MKCPARRKGVDCAFSVPDVEGVHREIYSPRHGGKDRRGVWHFWGTTMTVSERATFGLDEVSDRPAPVRQASARTR